MLIITNKRIAFVSKTDMTYLMHDTHSQRQLHRAKEGDLFRPVEGYLNT